MQRLMHEPNVAAEDFKKRSAELLDRLLQCAEKGHGRDSRAVGVVLDRRAKLSELRDLETVVQNGDRLMKCPRCRQLFIEGDEPTEQEPWAP